MEERRERKYRETVHKTQSLNHVKPRKSFSAGASRARGPPASLSFLLKSRAHCQISTILSSIVDAST